MPHRSMFPSENETEVIMEMVLGCISHISLRAEWIRFSPTLACYRGVMLCVGEQSSPRVIISPASRWAGDLHVSIGSPLSIFFLLLLLLLICSLYLPFLPSPNLAASITPSALLPALISLNSPHFASTGFIWIQLH